MQSSMFTRSSCMIRSAVVLELGDIVGRHEAPGGIGRTPVCMFMTFRRVGHGTLLESTQVGQNHH